MAYEIADTSAAIGFLTQFSNNPRLVRLAAYGALLQRGWKQTHTVRTDSITAPQFVAFVPVAQASVPWDVHFNFVSFPTYEFFRASLKSLPLDYKKSLEFGQIDAEFRDFLQLFAEEMNAKVTPSAPQKTHTLYEPDQVPAYTFRLNNAYALDCLRVDEAAFVDATYKYKGPGSVKKTEIYIDTLPSTCIREQQTGTPVSFCLTGVHGLATMLYTSPEHRGKSLGSIVMHEHAKKLKSFLGIAYACVEADNAASLALFRGIGWLESGCYVHWLKYEPLP